jgi:hypothetical protein
MACPANIPDEKSCSREFPYCLHLGYQPKYVMNMTLQRLPYCLHMACPDYICDEKTCSREFPYGLHMAYRAYILDENLFQRLPLMSRRGLSSLYT